MSDKKGKKVTIADEPSVQKPSVTPKATTLNVDSTIHASSGTASDPDILGPGVQHNWQNINSSGGQAVNLPAVNGYNPSFGQLPNVQQTGGFIPQFQQVPAPGAGCFHQNNNPMPHLNAFQLQQHNPYLINYAQPNLVQTGIATAPVAMPMMSHQSPVMVQGAQPIQAMPAMMPYQGIPTAMPTSGLPQPVGGVMGGQILAGNCAPDFLPQGMLAPDIMGIGRTQSENTVDLLNSMHKNNVLEPQGFKPEDDDPARMYCVRELDGNWTQRNRMTIDRLPCRWYITPHGAFYAVRLED